MVGGDGHLAALERRLAGFIEHERSAHAEAVGAIDVVLGRIADEEHLLWRQPGFLQAHFKEAMMGFARLSFLGTRPMIHMLGELLAFDDRGQHVIVDIGRDREIQPLGFERCERGVALGFQRETALQLSQMFLLIPRVHCRIHGHLKMFEAAHESIAKKIAVQVVVFTRIVLRQFRERTRVGGF